VAGPASPRAPAVTVARSTLPTGLQHKSGVRSSNACATSNPNRSAPSSES
jgi:hypothetical protein